jgi:hypothetical protein
METTIMKLIHIHRKNKHLFWDTWPTFRIDSIWGSLADIFFEMFMNEFWKNWTNHERSNALATMATMPETKTITTKYFLN